MKTLVMFQGCHAYVNSFFSDRNWHIVEPWDKLEAAGKPPVIVHATTNPNKPNAVFLTRDVKAGPVYDETTCLMGFLRDEQVSFEELESFAAHIGWGESLSRRVLVFVGGQNPLRPALKTGAGLQPFSSSWDADFWEKRLQEGGLEGVWATGKKAVVFEWGEVDDPPQPDGS